MIRRIIAALPLRIRWAPHNLIAHPLSEVLYQLGFEAASNALHDLTVPEHVQGEGRG